MKIAISTLACDGWSLEKSLEICKSSNIDALEIRMDIHEWSNIDMTEEECEEIYRKIREYGLVVSNLGTSVIVPEYKKESLIEIEKSAKIAKKMNCKGLRIMLGYFRLKWSEQMPEIDYAGIVKWLQEADIIMKKYDTEIWIETHNEFATGKSLIALLDDAKVERCKLLWDIMHPLEAEEQPEETIAFMKDKLVHVHIKNGVPFEDKDMANYKYKNLTEGSLPIKEIVTLLEKASYDGYYSLEWEGKWRKELMGPQFVVEDIISEYGKFMRTLIEE